MRELHALVAWWSGACSRELCLSVHQQGYGSTHHARPGRTSWSVTFTAATRVFVSSCGSIFPGRIHTVLRWTDRPSGFFAVDMTFAEDRRVLVISWLVGGQMTWEDAAELGGVSVATVGRCYRVFRRTGEFWPDDAVGQKHCDNALFNPDFLIAATSLIVDSPEAFLGEIPRLCGNCRSYQAGKGCRTRRRPCHVCCALSDTPSSVSSPTSVSAAPIDVGSLPGRYAACPSNA